LNSAHCCLPISLSFLHIVGKLKPPHRRRSLPEVDLTAAQQFGSSVEDPLPEVLLFGIGPPVRHIQFEDGREVGQHIALPVRMLTIEIEDALQRIAKDVARELRSDRAYEAMLVDFH
jgi:hypothetical protein